MSPKKADGISEEEALEQIKTDAEKKGLDADDFIEMFKGFVKEGDEPEWACEKTLCEVAYAKSTDNKTIIINILEKTKQDNMVYDANKPQGQKSSKQGEKLKALVVFKEEEDNWKMGIISIKDNQAAIDAFMKLKNNVSYKTKGNIGLPRNDGDPHNISPSVTTKPEKISDVITEKEKDALIDEVQLYDIATIAELAPGTTVFGRYIGIVAGADVSKYKKNLILRDKSVTPGDDPSFIEASMDSAESASSIDKFTKVMGLGYITNPEKGNLKMTPWYLKLLTSQKKKEKSDDDDDEDEKPKAKPKPKNDDDEDEAPKKSAPVKKSKEPEPKDEDEDEEEAVEEKPKPKAKTTAKAVYKASDCDEHGTGWDPDSSDCSECKKKDEEGYKECKHKTSEDEE